MTASTEEERSIQERLAVQRAWSERGLFLLREMLPLAAPVARFDGWTDEQRDTLGLLLTAAARGSESVFLLTAYGQLWDAEMVLRSVTEGTLKFIFLLESPAAFAQRHEEYAKALFEVALLKDHQKARDFLDATTDEHAVEWRPIRDRLLSESDHQTLRERYDRDRRRDLEQRWGFTALLNALSRRADSSFKGLSGLAWSYSLMSHLQHSDYLGIMLPLDRDSRASKRRDSLHFAHLARLIVDTLIAAANRLTVGYLFVGQDPEPIQAALARIEALRDSFGGAYERWTEIEYGRVDPGRASAPASTISPSRRPVRSRRTAGQPSEE